MSSRKGQPMPDLDGQLTTCHPDPAINVEIGRDAAHGELKDLAAGYLPRAWRCVCGVQHSRGPLPTGEHRCLTCGYIGYEGVMRDV
jgi:hypothetical protein